MKAVRALPSFDLEHSGAVFRFRVLGIAQVMQLRRRLMPDGERNADEVTAYTALLLAYAWDHTGPLGALDSAASLPDLRSASDSDLLRAGEAVLDEMSAAGLTFADLTALFSAVLRRLLGGDAVAEAGQAASFTAARKD